MGRRRASGAVSLVLITRVPTAELKAILQLLFRPLRNAARRPRGAWHGALWCDDGTLTPPTCTHIRDRHLNEGEKFFYAISAHPTPALSVAY